MPKQFKIKCKATGLFVSDVCARALLVTKLKDEALTYASAVDADFVCSALQGIYGSFHFVVVPE